jgi:hypothetical protein
VAARLLVFAGALAGLFVMHGLSDHGASSHELHAAMSPAVMETSRAGHPADAAPSATDDAQRADEDAPGEDSPKMAVAGLCLAVLAGAIIGLLLLHPHRSLFFTRPRAHDFVAARPSGRRDRDPPCLFQLAVLRT